MQSDFPKIPLLLSILFFLFFLVAFSYFFKETNDDIEKSQLIEIELQTEKNRRSEVETLDDSIEKTQIERMQLGTHFARSSDVVPFLDTIEGLALEVGVKADISSVDVLKDPDRLSLGIKITGTFSGFYRFLTLLENSSYELKVMSMDMHKETVSEVLEEDSVASKWVAVFRIELVSFSQ